MDSSVQSLLEDLLQLLMFMLFENVDSTMSDPCRSSLYATLVHET